MAKTLDDIRAKAVDAVKLENPGSTDHKASEIYANVMGGEVVTVSFDSGGKEEKSHVHFGPREMRVYRRYNALLSAISNSRESNWFFRFIELVGISGVTAFILMLLLMIMLAVAMTTRVESGVLELLKYALTSVLGFLFGSQTSKR